MTQLLESVDSEFYKEKLGKENFESSFEKYQNLFSKILENKKFSTSQVDFLYKYLYGINNNAQLWNIFVNWHEFKQEFTREFSSQAKSLLDNMTFADFGQFTQMPVLNYSLVPKLEQLKRKMEKNTIEQDQTKTDNVRINKYNDLLQQIITEQKGKTNDNSLVDLVLNQEEKEYKQLKLQVQYNETYSSVVEEYYKQRRIMVTKVFHFCDKLEKKLIQFIKEFNGQHKTQDEIAKLKSEYENIREILTKITTVTNIDTQQLIQIDGNVLSPSYSIEEFRRNLTELGKKIVGDYIKDDQFSIAVSVINKLGKLDINQDQLLFELILSSVLFSQIKLRYNLDMTYDQLAQDIKENLQMVYIRADIDAADLDTYYDKCIPYIKRYYTEIYTPINAVAGAAAAAQQPQVYDTVFPKYKQLVADVNIAAVNGYVTLAARIDELNRYFGLAGGVANIPGNAGAIGRAVANQFVNAQFQRIGFNAVNVWAAPVGAAIANCILRLPPIFEINEENKIQVLVQQILTVQDLTISRSPDLFVVGPDAQSASKLIMNLYHIDDGGNYQARLKTMGESVTRQKLGNQNVAGKGLVLKYIQNQEDVVMKLTSQAIDSIYSTLLIQLQAIQTSPEELSIAQIIGAGNQQPPRIIRGAEMFYQLFATAALSTKKYFHDNETDNKLNLKLQLPYESQFKIPFDFIIQNSGYVQVNPLSQSDFMVLVGHLNKIWNSSNESTERQNNKISKRTQVLLQRFMDDLMKGLSFTFGKSIDKNAISELNNLQVQQNIIQTTGFSVNPVNLLEKQNSKRLESMFQLPGTKFSFNDKYQQLVDTLHEMILNQTDSTYDDKQFQTYVKQYYSNINYNDNSLERYVYDQYNKFVHELHNNKTMNNTITSEFMMEFGVLYYYYLLYFSNVMSVLQEYHKEYIDNRVLNQKLPFNLDGSVFEQINPPANIPFINGPGGAEILAGQVPELDQYTMPIFQAIYAATHDSTDPFFKAFYETLGRIQMNGCLWRWVVPVGAGAGVAMMNTGNARVNVDLNADLMTHAAGNTIKQKFEFLLTYFGTCQYIQDRSMEKGKILPERLDQMWQQYQYIIDDRQKQIAYILNMMLSASLNAGVLDYSRMQSFINNLQKHKIFDTLFKQIENDTVKIGKIVITLNARANQPAGLMWPDMITGTEPAIAPVNEDDEAGAPAFKAGLNIPAGVVGNAGTFDRWDGDALKVSLIANTYGVKKDICRKYYLNENYENILVNWYYPKYIYPMNLDDHITIQQKIVKKLPLVKYTDNGFMYDDLVKFLDDTKENILKKFYEFFTEDTTFRQYYTNQLKTSLDVSGLIQAIFVKKIIPVCSIKQFKSNYKQLQPYNYEDELRFKFQRSDEIDDNQTLFSLQNMYENTVSVVSAGKVEEGKIPQAVTSITNYYDKIIVSNAKHSDLGFEINAVNGVIRKLLNIFACSNKYNSIPIEIIRKFKENKYILQQLQLKEVKTPSGYVINLPANGIQIPFSLLNQQLENQAIQKIDELATLQLQGGDKEQIAQTYEQIQFRNVLTRSDMSLIKYCTGLTDLKDVSRYADYEQRMQLYRQGLGRPLYKIGEANAQAAGFSINDLLLMNVWQQIEKYDPAFCNTVIQINGEDYSYLDVYEALLVTHFENLTGGNVAADILQNKREQFDYIRRQLAMPAISKISQLSQILKYAIQTGALKQSVTVNIAATARVNPVGAVAAIAPVPAAAGVVAVPGVAASPARPAYPPIEAIPQDTLIQFVGDSIKIVIHAALLEKTKTTQIINQFVGDGEPLYIYDNPTQSLKSLSQQYQMLSLVRSTPKFLYQKLREIISINSGHALNVELQQILSLYNNDKIRQYFMLISRNKQYVDLNIDVAGVAVTLGINGVAPGAAANAANRQVASRNFLQRYFVSLDEAGARNAGLLNFPNVDQMMDLYNNMCCALAIMHIIENQTTNNSINIDSLITADKIGNYINNLNRITALIPYLQGLSLQRFVELSTNKKFQLPGQIRYTFLQQRGGGDQGHVFQGGNLHGGNVNFAFSGFQVQDMYTCAVFVSAAVNNNQQYNYSKIEFREADAWFRYVNENRSGWNLYNMRDNQIPFPNMQTQLYGGMIRSRDIYDAFNYIVPNYNIIDFQSGNVYPAANALPAITFKNLFINMPPDKESLVGKILNEQRAKFTKDIVVKSQIILYIYNEERQMLERFDPDKEVRTEQYKNKLLITSNIAALNKVNETQQYTNEDRLKILNELITNDSLSEEIKNYLQYYNFSEQANSILSTVYNVIEDFIKQNYEKLMTDKEYGKMYNQYKQQYEEMLNMEQHDLFNFPKLFDGNHRFSYWMGLEAEHFVNKQFKENDKYSQFKQIWLQMRKLYKAAGQIKHIPFQRAKLYFTRYLTNDSRYIGEDHYFTVDGPVVDNVDVWSYKNNVATRAGAGAGALTDEQSQSLKVQNINQLFKLQGSDLKNLSEELFKLQSYVKIGLANVNGMSKYYASKLRKLIEANTFKLRDLDTGVDFANGEFPFQRADVDYGTLFINSTNVGGNYPRIRHITTEPHDILLQNSIYKYDNIVNVNILYNPLPLIVHLQQNSGISEPDITKSATTFGVSVVPIINPNAPVANTPRLQYQMLLDYFQQFNNCVFGRQLYTLDAANVQQTQMNKIFKIIGVNPINPISLIKNNLSFPIINILSLFLKTYMRRQLIGKRLQGGPNSLEGIFLRYIEEEYNIVQDAGVVTGFTAKQNKTTHPSRYLQHILSNGALFLMKMKEKRLQLSQQYAIDNYTITLNSVQDISQ